MSNRLLCLAILEDYKCSFYKVTQGKEAIGIIKKSINIDCIIMNLSMPIMNGFEASKKIRENLNLNIPIIEFTANIAEDL